MSFQDFASNSARPSRTSAGRVTTGNSAPGPSGSLGPISESLLQYQRNVGILEKIVQSMTNQKNSEEAALQYSAQVDVITQLASRVEQQLAAAKRKETGAAKTALIKLERDFNQVQDRVNSLQTSVTKMREQQAAKRAAMAAAAGQDNVSSENMTHEEFQQHMELQLQQDRLAEEIMREREEEIRKINQGMHQVNAIYKDLAHIVAGQQEHVDAIETQMEDSRANAEAGLNQVQKANEQFGNAKCIIS